MQIRRALALTAVFTLVVGALPMAAQNDNKNQPKRSKAEQQDIDVSAAVVDRVSTGQMPVPADIALTWEANHFTKGQEGQTYIPFTLIVDKTLASKQVAYYVRVVEKGTPAVAPEPDPKDKKAAAAAPARPIYPWERISFTQVPASGKMSRALVLKPGEYDAYIVIKEKFDKEVKDLAKQPLPKVAFLKRELSVPSYDGAAELKVSTPILASLVEPLTAPLTPAQLEENPYNVFGAMKIEPSADGKFSKAGEFNLVFFVYGAGDAGGGKPNVVLEYSFYQKQTEGEKYFNKTAPQDLNGLTLPPDFNVAAGHQVPGMLSIPLASFPAGDYRLEIKVTDKASNKTLTQNVAFTVTA